MLLINKIINCMSKYWITIFVENPEMEVKKSHELDNT
jgi:hypothetical protein